MIFPGILGFLSKPLIALIGGIWGLLGIVIAFVARTYLVPLLEVDKNRRYAEWIARIADELTDDLVQKYPGKKWIEFLDKTVDEIMEICGISEKTAKRAISAALRRKKNTVVTK